MPPLFQVSLRPALCGGLPTLQKVIQVIQRVQETRLDLESLQMMRVINMSFSYSLDLSICYLTIICLLCIYLFIITSPCPLLVPLISIFTLISVSTCISISACTSTPCRRSSPLRSVSTSAPFSAWPPLPRRPGPPAASVSIFHLQLPLGPPFSSSPFISLPSCV